MATIYLGQSLRIVKNSGTAATDHVDNATGKTITGKPVTITGSKGTLTKYSGISPDLYTAIVGESDPAKRNALLTNVHGKVLSGTRAAISRTTFDAFVAEHLASVTPDGTEPTPETRALARARVRSFLDGGLVAMPDADGDDGDDALSWAFGVADDAPDEDEDEETAPAPGGKAK